MKKLSRTLLFSILALAFVSLACSQFYSFFETPSAETVTPAPVVTWTPDSPSAQPDETLPTLPPESCLPDEVWHPDEGICFIEDDAALDAILPDFYDRIAADLADEIMPSETIEPETETLLTSYQIIDNHLAYPEDQPVSANLRPLQTDRLLHVTLWANYAALIPPSARPELIEVHIFTDGGDGTLAFVERTIDDPHLWALGLDPQDIQDFGNLNLTLIHEYGHLLSLNSNQVPPNMDLFYDPDNDAIYAAAENACSTYFTGEGCAKADSYINVFYQRYWADIFDEWLTINNLEDADEYYTAMDDFYTRYRSRFVSDYAVTNPEEDFAETWAYFVLQPEPAGDSMADDKLRFFYEYPELIALRRQIIARLYSRMIRYDAQN